jgi:hypothetical protein
VVTAGAKRTRGAAGGETVRRRAAAIGRRGGLVAPVVALLAVLLPAPGARAAGPGDAFFYAEIHSNLNGLCVNVAENSTDAGVKIQQYHCDHTPADKFFFVAAGPGGFYEIRGQNSNLCITPDPYQSLHDGTPLVQWPCTGAATQFWQPGPQGNGNYVLYDDGSEKCMTVPNSSRDDWIQLQIQACNGNQNQDWSLVTS